MAASDSSDQKGQWLGNFIARLGHSRFFTVSVALHFVLVLTLGSVVLVRQITPRTDFDDPGGSLVNPPPAAAPDALQPLVQPTDEVSTTVSHSLAPSLSALTTAATTQTAFSLPSANLAPNLSGAHVISNAVSTSASVQSPRINGIPTNLARGMVQFTKSWVKGGDSGNGVGKDRAFKFTAYLAKYSGGDWDSTVRLRDGRITTGSLPNLLFIVRKWSRDKIDADADAVPLDLSSDDLFVKKPPFVFFTGHEDFHLSDQEIANLQKYLQLGGAIWGDSSLPGERSRFDLAFRREMKRVLPDQDIAWEVLPKTHDIYTKKYFTEVQGTPPGMNGFDEPVYALRNMGEIAVIYTPNDYGDLWQIGVTEQGDYDLTRDEHGAFAATNGTIFDHREAYFRGTEAKNVVNSYKFGTNIILHLLTRWEDKLRNVPTGL